MKTLILLSVILFSGCSSSRLVSSWSAPQAGRLHYKKILVKSMAPADDSTTRLRLEQEMVKELAAIGCQAVSFLQTFDEKLFRYMRYDSAHARFQEQGIDGIITINLVGKENEPVYVPGKPVRLVEFNKSASYWTSETNKEVQKDPGYFVNSIQSFWESSFYDLGSLDLLYHAQSTSFDPVPAKKLANQYGKQIVYDLRKHYVLTETKRK